MLQLIGGLNVKKLQRREQLENTQSLNEFNFVGANQGNNK